MAITRVGLGGPLAGASSTVRSRPVSVLVSGSWTPVNGASLFAVVADDDGTTYMQSSSGVDLDECILTFPAGTPIAGDITLTLRYRATP